MPNDTQATNLDSYEPRVRQGTYFDRRYAPPQRDAHFIRSGAQPMTPQQRYEQYDAQRHADMNEYMRKDVYNGGMQYKDMYRGNPRYSEVPPYVGYSSGYAGREHIDIDPAMIDRFMSAAREMGSDAVDWFMRNYRVVPRNGYNGQMTKASGMYDMPRTGRERVRVYPIGPKR